jgi:hypothetical protein
MGKVIGINSGIVGAAGAAKAAPTAAAAAMQHPDKLAAGSKAAAGSMVPAGWLLYHVHINTKRDGSNGFFPVNDRNGYLGLKGLAGFVEFHFVHENGTFAIRKGFSEFGFIALPVIEGLVGHADIGSLIVHDKNFRVVILGILQLPKMFAEPGFHEGFHEGGNAGRIPPFLVHGLDAVQGHPFCVLGFDRFHDNRVGTKGRQPPLGKVVHPLGGLFRESHTGHQDQNK